MIDEVDSFLFRPHLNLRAKYHAVRLLTLLLLSFVLVVSFAGPLTIFFKD